MKTDARDINAKGVELKSMTRERCLQWCRNHWNAVACEFLISPLACWVHTSQMVPSDEHDSGYQCYIFPGDTFTEVHI